MRTKLIAAVLAVAMPVFADGFGDIFKKPPKPATPAAQPPAETPPAHPTKGIWGQNTSAPATTAQQDSAKMSLDVAEIELQASKLYLAGLADLAARPTTWDRDHTVGLFNQAQRTVIRAEEHLGEMEKLATGSWANAGDALRRARASLVDTEQQLRAFSAPMKSGQLQAQGPASIKNLWNSIDKAQKELEGAASTMGVDFHLKGL